MKKFLCLFLAGVLIFGMGFSVFWAQADTATVYVKSANVYVKGAFTWLDFILSEQVKAARNFQTAERREEPSDFPDALVAATNKCFKLDGISLGEWSEAMDGSQYVLMCHFEYDEKKGIQYLRILTIPQFIDINKDFTFEVTSGFITAEYKKFNPFKFTWNAKTQTYKLEQEGVATTTNAQITTGGTTSQTSKPTSANTRQDNQTTATNAGPTESTTPATSGTRSTEVETFLPTLGSYDIIPKTSDIMIDIHKKTVTLDKRMKVKDFLSNVDVVNGYTLRVFENLNEVTDENAFIRSGAVLRIETQGEKIGELIFEVNQSRNPYMPVIIVLIVVGVLLIVGGVLFFFIIGNRNSNPNSESV